MDTTVGEKMKALADEVRELSGTTVKMGIENMTIEINSANDTIAEQANLLAQVITALDGKAAGGAPADLVLQDKTVTPTTSQQTVTADSGYDGLDTVTVEAIPSDYVKPTATKAATTYTPGTSNQTVAAGTYCSGVQTIKGDANLKAENIASGVNIFGVTGTHSGGENLDTVLAEQQTLLNNLSTILDNKASGGGNSAIETCTVILDTSTLGNDPIYYVSASVLNNGSMSCYHFEGDTSTVTVTIQNVVCGSTIAFISSVYYSNGGNNLYTEIEGSATIQDVYNTVDSYDTLLIIVQAPSIAGETSTIRFVGAT